MKSSLLQLLVPSSLLLSSASAVLHVPITKTRSNVLAKRDTVTQKLDNEQSLYLADLELGSQSEKVTVQIDTGSSDLWVPSKSAEVCTEGYCEFGSCECQPSPACGAQDND